MDTEGKFRLNQKNAENVDRREGERGVGRGKEKKNREEKREKRGQKKEGKGAGEGGWEVFRVEMCSAGQLVREGLPEIKCVTDVEQEVGAGITGATRKPSQLEQSHRA